MELNPCPGHLFMEVGIALLSVLGTRLELHNSLNGLQLKIRYILQGKLSRTVFFSMGFSKAH